LCRLGAYAAGTSKITAEQGLQIAKFVPKKDFASRITLKPTNPAAQDPYQAQTNIISQEA
jgi:hypothetical protein